ncbi:hypothetical protein M9H77_16753 [Catharanthus roseus]|uniref:Uncharacterized protein n=1 Tax=Catharanthus roseus TaxID=4058 RepID=A0ACC0B2N0_CATRO|nr:hypothetical protein M9H77_16753 [Catharanthus roseus]
MQYNRANLSWKRIEIKSKQEDYQSKLRQDMHNFYHGCDNGFNAYGGNNYGIRNLTSRRHVRVDNFTSYANCIFLMMIMGIMSTVLMIVVKRIEDKGKDIEKELGANLEELPISKTFEDHGLHFQQVLFVLRNTKSHASLGTFEFCVEHGTLYSKFSRSQVGANMVQVIQDWLISKSPIEEETFYGFTSRNKKFIKDLSTIASHLRDVAKKMTSFTWQIYFHLIKFASNKVHHSPTLYCSLEVDYGFKLLRPFAFIPFSIGHVLCLDEKTHMKLIKYIYLDNHEANKVNNKKFGMTRLVFDPGGWVWIAWI